MIGTRIIAILISMGALSGCAGLNSNFKCNKTAGDSCETISVVNQKANDGFYDFSGVTNKTPNNSLFNSEFTGYKTNAPLPGAPVRYAEVTQRIWIAPYQDLEENYHEPSFVYVVL